MVKTTLPDGLETSGWRAYRLFWHISRLFWVFAFWMIFSVFKKNGFWGILGPPGNHASRWIRDLWSKGISLILAYLLTFLSFWVMDDFFRLKKKKGLGVFLVHPPMASVLLSASVERCFFYRMRDFFLNLWQFQNRAFHTVNVFLLFSEVPYSGGAIHSKTPLKSKIPLPTFVSKLVNLFFEEISCKMSKNWIFPKKYLSRTLFGSMNLKPTYC